MTQLMRLVVLSLVPLGVFVSAGCAAMTEAEAPAPQVQTAPAPANRPAWLTPEKEAALIEARKILKEAREVAEGIKVPSKLRILRPPEVRLTGEEQETKWLLGRIEKIQFRAGDFSAGATTTLRASLAFAQLQYGQVHDALRVLRDERLRGERLGEVGALTLVQTLAQTGYMEAAIEMADAHSKYERASEGRLFALIAREQMKLGDTRAHDTLQRARMAAKFGGSPNDRALSLVHVAQAQRSLGDRAGSDESLRWALDAAVNAPRDRSTMVLRTIAVAQADNGDRTGSAQLFKRIREEENSLNSSQRVQRLASQACDLAVRGYRSSATEMFQEAMQIADGLPVGEQIRMWREIGQRLVKSGDQVAVRTLVQRMVETAESIADERIKQETLSTASGLSTKVGDLDMAMGIAATIKDGSEKALALRWLAERMATTAHSPDLAILFRKLSDTAKDLPQSKLPTEKATANRMLANIAGIQAVTGDVPSAIQSLKRITNQDYHQESGAYPEIIRLLAQQGNFTGARQVADNVERKRWEESPMAFALKSLGRAYAEAGDTQTALDWARHIKVGYAKALILMGVAEGLMNRQGIEHIVEERPELALQRRCEVDQWTLS